MSLYPFVNSGAPDFREKWEESLLCKMDGVI